MHVPDVHGHWSCILNPPFETHIGLQLGDADIFRHTPDLIVLTSSCDKNVICIDKYIMIVAYVRRCA